MPYPHHLEIREIPGGGTSFYIDGSLQFNSHDEFIYHETLVLPAAGLLGMRSRKDFRALILGGGDGLALRELLKFRKLKSADIVDYDREVVRYAKTHFAPWNNHAFRNKRAAVVIQDARRYLESCRKIYDLIIADFTFPDNLETGSLFTANFYSLMKRCLAADGVVAVNAVSPEMSAPAYWSIFKTLSALKLHPRPLAAEIPSFLSHGYGAWGFFLASPSPILSRELRGMKMTVPAKYLTRKIFLENMKFPRRATALGLSLAKILQEPADLPGLFNLPFEPVREDGPPLDFSGRISLRELEKLGVDHRWMTPELAGEWQSRLLEILKTLDWEALFEEIENQLEGPFAVLRDEFEKIRKDLPVLLKQKVFRLENLHKLFAVLLILMILINVIFPDNAYAKGGGGYHGGHSGNSGDTEIVMTAPVPRSPFHSLLYPIAAGAGAPIVTDMMGKAHPQKSLQLADGHGGIRRETGLFALADDLYISKSGEICLLLMGTPFQYQIEPDRFILFDDVRDVSLFEFAPDPQVMQTFLNNLGVQRKALERTLGDYDKWLAWAQPAGLISKEIRDEVKEVQNLKSLRGLFDQVNDSMQMGASVLNEPSNAYRLVPGLYLSGQGSLLFRKPDGTCMTYVYQGFQAEPGLPVLESSEKTDRFVEGVARWTLAQPNAPENFKVFLRDKTGIQQKQEGKKPNAAQASSNW